MLRVCFYGWYGHPNNMCKFLTVHPNWYITFLSLVEIVGEATPIIVIFTIQVVFQIYKQRKQKKTHPYNDPNESRDLGHRHLGVS